MYPAAIGRAHPISKEAQYGSMADVNGARDKFANSFKPALGANMYTYPADLSGTPTITLPVGSHPRGATEYANRWTAAE